MRRVLVAVALAATVLVPTGATAAPAGATTTAARPADHVFPRGLAYAPSEGECYSYRCVWDARHQGNGRGQSVLLTRWRGGFIAVPISHRRAHRLHVAYCQRRDVTCRGYAD